MAPLSLSGCKTPSFLVFKSVSSTLKILSALTIPICKVLNLSANSLMGLNSIFKYIIKETMTPKETASCITSLDPYQTNIPIDVADINSTTGKKIE